MAKKSSTTTDDEAAGAPAAIDPAAYYRVEVTGRIRVGGVGFGPSSKTEVTGAILERLLASEHSAKVRGWAPA